MLDSAIFFRCFLLLLLFSCLFAVVDVLVANQNLLLTGRNIISSILVLRE